MKCMIMLLSKNIAIFNAAPYAGGVLAKGPDNFKKVTYQDATEEKLSTCS